MDSLTSHLEPLASRPPLVNKINLIGRVAGTTPPKNALCNSNGMAVRIATRLTALENSSLAYPSIVHLPLLGILYTKKGRPGPGQGFQVNFIMQDGEEITVQAHEGESLLDVAWANDIDIEGACEASLACSTCHLILDEPSYSKLEEPTDEENDMLDLAFGLSDTYVCSKVCIVGKSRQETLL